MQVAAFLAKAMVVKCFRDTILEDIHSGIHPVTHTGIFSDIVVIDANGWRIPWPEVAHIEPDELRDLMRWIVTRLYTCNVKAGDFDFLGMLDWAAREAQARDEPELDEITIGGLERRRMFGPGDGIVAKLAGTEPAAGGPGRLDRRPVAGRRPPAPSSDGVGRGREDRALVSVLDGIGAEKSHRWMAERILGEARVASEWSSESWMRAQVRRWIPKAGALAAGGWRDLVPRHFPEPWRTTPTAGPGA